MTYDSTQDTLDHIAKVQTQIGYVVTDLIERANQHDRSKLLPPEKEVFDRVTPKLQTLTYGSDEYKASLAEMGPALKHHYNHNSHHPEFYTRGVDDMTLMDLIEMLCDWRAASMRHANGSIAKSLEINRSRFEISDQLFHVLENTALTLGWIAMPSERQPDSGIDKL